MPGGGVVPLMLCDDGGGWVPLGRAVLGALDEADDAVAGVCALFEWSCPGPPGAMPSAAACAATASMAATRAMT